MADDPTMQNTYRAPGVSRPLAPFNSHIGDAARAHRVELEDNRRGLIARQRDYYGGEQYAAFNKDRLDTLCRDQKARSLPEHERQHAYSVHVAESVNYLAARISEGFDLDADDDAVDGLLERVIASTDALSSVNEDGETVPSTDEPLRDALIAGDVAVLVGYDPVDDVPTLELWESEAVEFVPADNDRSRIVEVVLRYPVWGDDGRGIGVELERECRYDLRVSPWSGQQEAHLTVYDRQPGATIDETQPTQQRWLGLGRLPWALLRADRSGLRDLRGRSLITPQVMETADRYNSVEQTGFLIARYNSHSNVVVIGDAAMAQSLKGQTVIHKDVADIITLPEGTAATPLSLPTDPNMIDHQRSVLESAIYAAFGLVRMDPESLSGLGTVSGYALEILNSRATATFGRVARAWRKDWAALVDLILDVDAWCSAEPVYLPVADPYAPVLPAPEPDDNEGDPLEVAAAPDGYVAGRAWWDVDPDDVYPNRVVSIRLGTGAVVDDVKARDDYTSGLISRREALIQRGYTPEQADTIGDEIAAEEAAPGSTTEGTTWTPDNSADVAGQPEASGTVQPATRARGTLGGTLGSSARTD